MEEYFAILSKTQVENVLELHFGTWLLHCCLGHCIFIFHALLSFGFFSLSFCFLPFRLLVILFFGLGSAVGISIWDRFADAMACWSKRVT
jgi:hypothetical protein